MNRATSFCWFALSTELFQPFILLILLITSVVGIDNEQGLYKKPITRAYARRSALFEPKAVEPPDGTVDDDTLQECSQTQDDELTNGVYSFPFLNIGKFSTKFFSSNITEAIGGRD